MGVFLWILRYFWEHLFYRTPPGGWFWSLIFFFLTRALEQGRHVVPLVYLAHFQSSLTDFLIFFFFFLQKQLLQTFHYFLRQLHKLPAFFSKTKSSRLEVFCRKGVLRNFAKFTGKHLCQTLFSNKVAGFLQSKLY